MADDDVLDHEFYSFFACVECCLNCTECECEREDD